MARLGKYELHEQLGRGGFGTVYRATDTSLGRPVALKILHPQMAADADFVERFRKEARLAAQLESPHVVTIHEVGEEAGRYFIAMRYYPGGSLADRLKDGPLPWDKCVSILAQVCEGLHLLHIQGWVHRDLKPSNILFDPQGRAVIADFGLARALTTAGSASSSGGFAGTPHYKAPELWRGRPPASPATDVYALGCILGEMLTGHLLFPGDTPDEVMTKHVLDGPEFGEKWPQAGVPEGAKEFIQRCLSKSPDGRPADAAVFLRELRALGSKTALPLKVAGPLVQPTIVAASPSKENPPLQPQRQPLSESHVPGQESLPVSERQIDSLDTNSPATPWKQIAYIGGLGILGVIILLFIGFVGKYILENVSDKNPQEPMAVNVGGTTDCTQIGQTQISSIDGMTQVCVPAGEFRMGSDKNVDSQAYDDELPQHTVYLDAYWIDQTEVTNAAYAAFLNSQINTLDIEGEIVKLEGKTIYDLVCTDCGNWTDQINWNGAEFNSVDEYSKHPVALVTWDGAQAYCEWAGRRLPTEAEWEKAARGTDDRIYPWGNDFLCSKVNADDETVRDDYVVAGGVGCDGFDKTAPIGSFQEGASPYGALDMAGNVWEWVADWYGETYYQNSPDNNPQGPQTGEYRVRRGGSWDDGSFYVRASVRDRNNPGNRNIIIGFRCAR